MVYEGRVENGRIILDPSVTLPEGTKVSVVVSDPTGQFSGDEERIPTLYERLKAVIGTAQGLPHDAARQADHYLYGHPKR